MQLAFKFSSYTLSSLTLPLKYPGPPSSMKLAQYFNIYIFPYTAIQKSFLLYSLKLALKLISYFSSSLTQSLKYPFSLLTETVTHILISPLFTYAATQISFTRSHCNWHSNDSHIPLFHYTATQISFFSPH